MEYTNTFGTDVPMDTYNRNIIWFIIIAHSLFANYSVKESHVDVTID